MNAAYVRAMAQTGDVLAVHGNDIEQKGIQFATCSPFCHVAMLVRIAGSGLMVVETLEPHGYRSLTFDEWMMERAGQGIFYGQAPDKVRQGKTAIKERLSIYSDPKAQKYDFAALPLVWLSGLTGKDYHPHGEVCSLLVADEWEATGFDIPGNAAPGDFLFLCESVSLIR